MTIYIADTSPPSLSLKHLNRSSGREGGIAYLVREQFKVNITHTPGS